MATGAELKQYFCANTFKIIRRFNGGAVEPSNPPPLVRQ